MNELVIELADDVTTFEPGAQLAGTVRWELDDEPESVELRLVWNTAGKGDRDLHVVDTVVFDRPRRRESREVNLTLPAQPYSFSGKLISLIWALELIAFPSNASWRREITIAPGGEEIQLPAVGK
jgi:hypothetical protein